MIFIVFKKLLLDNRPFYSNKNVMSFEPVKQVIKYRILRHELKFLFYNINTTTTEMLSLKWHLCALDLVSFFITVRMGSNIIAKIKYNNKCLSVRTEPMLIIEFKNGFFFANGCLFGTNRKILQIFFNFSLNSTQQSNSKCVLVIHQIK